jgi:hypothetical protein
MCFFLELTKSNYRALTDELLASDLKDDPEFRVCIVLKRVSEIKKIIK